MKQRFSQKFASKGFSSKRALNDVSLLDESILYGFHPVSEALKNPKRKHKKLIATQNGIHKLEENGISISLEPEIVRPNDIARLLPPDAVHQGLYLISDPLPSVDVRTLPDDGLVIVLDQITDPHNVGAIMRTAVAFNAAGIMCTYRHSPATTGVLAKSASGGLEHINLIMVTNLSEGITQLIDSGYTVVGLDSDGETDINTLPLTRPLALVLGAEGKGLRQKTKETCTVVARLDMPGVIKSLNVSNAAAIALNAAHQAHLKTK